MRASTKDIAYGGYFKNVLPEEDHELTHTDPGTPMGEYMRKFWQPVCLSQELTELPKAVRILGQDLVAFRDRSGQVGVLNRYCSHRGTSLEYGIIQQKGIRCCYHGWLYDVDGTILETPAEPANSKIKETVFHGAYPAFERDGLVFAYLGPPDEKPKFPQYDGFSQPDGTKLVAFSNIYPCNWLQVYENIMDHVHTALLHNNMTVESVDQSDKDGLNLDGFFDMPIMDWASTRQGNGMVFMANRRNPDEKTVWLRMTEMQFPNFLQIGSLFPSARRERHSSMCLSRWHVPVDDTHMIMFGWRHFNDEVDPDQAGDESDCGYDKIDFLVGQCERPYEAGQRAPGDWEALSSQHGNLARHSAENPGVYDIGVYQCRKLLRELVRGETPAAESWRRQDRDGSGQRHMYTHDTVVFAPKQAGGDDNALVLELGRKVFAIMQEGDELPSAERDSHIRRRISDIDGGHNDVT
ncbi:MAG: phenylpropionate dioxygenase-like ring-hydroxylating dioxygenase large terminal subunit [Gammaproteobacteria bacterium]|jgi:phenylpropionate dioxygenase-like ring-hydroxylating dioxygenase large terminal subunit